MQISANIQALAYLLSAVLFILSLKGLTHPSTARRGNVFGMIGMAMAEMLGADGAQAERAALLLCGDLGVAGRVEFLGQVDNLEEVLPVADVLLLPSLHESFGLVALEAMACGAPVIASSGGALPEVLGDTGLLVDPADRDGWTAALGRMEDDDRLRREYRERGLARARELA